MQPLLFLALVALQDDVGIEFFETRIRPVLSENCFKCHGKKKQRSELRVDSRAWLLAGGERGPALVPGDAAASLLMRAVSYEDEELEMPPRGKLDESLIADLERWVAAGAPAPDEQFTVEIASDFDLGERAEHWSYQPITDPPVPGVSEDGWARDDVDRFLLAALEAEGLSHADPADRATLIRRLSFDLRGLPPTVEEIEAFQRDEAPDAYERLVDRFLASPHFGETWARHWLDLVGYAETKGHEFDHTTPNAYQYRDYVIRALNADVPFDRFVTEHLAGDLVPQPRPHPEEGWDESILATGFWHLGTEVHSPVDIRGDQVERMAEKIDVFSKAFLGVTVACARCHDHKFEPVTQEDYYALSGYILSASYRQVRFETREAEASAAARIARQRDREEAGARERTALVLQALPRPYLASVDDAELERARQDPGHPLFAYARLRGSSDAFAAERDAVLATWAELEDRSREFLDRAQVILDYGASGALDRAPLLSDGSAFGPGPVRAGDVRVSLGFMPHLERVHPYPAASYDPAWSRLRVTEGTQKEESDVGWAPSGRTLRTPRFTLERRYLNALVRGPVRAFAVVDDHRLIKGPLHLRTVQRSDAADDELRWVTMDLEDYPGHAVHLELAPFDGWRELEVLMVAASDEPPGVAELSLAGLRAALESEAIRGAAELGAALESMLVDAVEFVRTGRAPRGAAPGDLARLADWLLGRIAVRENHPLGEFESVLAGESRTAPAMFEGTGFDERLLIRGSHHSPGDVVPRRLLEVLGGKQGRRTLAGSGRLDLARRMTAPSNPLVARVQVNRIWMHVFGRGLVSTVDNLGVSGQAPSHPALLDHLSTRFVRGGWSNKRLIRALVTTSAYRQASVAATPEAGEVDATNRLLHRMPVRRLTAEKIRDSILAVSGGLDARIYGPSVPIHLTPFLDGRGRPGSGPVDGDGRRSIYLGVRRNFLSPFLQAFDFPAPAGTVGRRGVSNVPAQALALMNDPFVVEQARRWGRGVAEQGGDVDQRVRVMYMQAFARAPEESELGAAAESLGAGDDAEAWESLAHVLFNVKEFVFLD